MEFEVPSAAADIARERDLLRRMQGHDVGYDNDTRQIDESMLPQAMRIAGVPERFCREPLPDLSQVDPAVQDWFRNLNRDSTPGVLMHGKRGGKSYAAAAIVKECLRKGRTVRWISYADYQRMHTLRLATDVSKDTDTADDLSRFRWRLRKGWQVLVVDGVDLSTNALFVISELTSLLHERADEGLYSIVTGRTPPYDIKDAPYEVRAHMDMVNSLYLKVRPSGGE